MKVARINQSYLSRRCCFVIKEVDMAVCISMLNAVAEQQTSKTEISLVLGVAEMNIWLG